MPTSAAAEGRLRVLEAVTDSALARLDLDKVIAALVTQVPGLLQVDTAAVLLYDHGSDELIATAATGLEEEVWQGVHIPVGVGFAGHVAACREPVILDRVDKSTVVNPLLWLKGIQTMLGVPMLVHGELVGVLHVGSFTQHRFTEDDVALLQLVGDRLALAAHVRVATAERAALTALQRSLLPAHLPSPPGLEFAARYVPGSDTTVGGDWYDVFELPGERIGIAIGDVAGHGLAAGIVMGRLRSALRAYALDHDDPGEVMCRLDRKASHFEQGAMATVGYAVIDATHNRMRLSLAGHPAPVLAAPNQPTRLLDAAPDPPIGFGLATGHRGCVTVDLPPGAVLAFYTDGLVERRGHLLDDGLALLRDTVVPDSPAAVCAHVMSTLVGAQPANDDIALLVARRTPD
ncbi:MAG TPA: GAF domain-containing SpoIIE family protein phosphatase [Actinophytocola sp.]|uniref:PP2C family protein-serine/threonine phosphatase n=1 Tax=Actinophytocola sp. TaxID=1872138 RepID=UPI002DBAE04D|nr:GAF domain-containing SpoIIE family protein phosphatase [Actinophytocola sp.]HEU5474719.1 GAF domain-containing SpoIIE family protein phosphatase [Actinophytocola sp.]